MTGNRTWSAVLFGAFGVVVALSLGLAASARSALRLLHPSATRNHFLTGSGLLGVSAAVMYVAVQPGLLRRRAHRRAVFLLALGLMGAAHAVKATGWIELREAILERRALERIIADEQRDQ